MEFKIIESTPLYNAFSERGKRIFLPDGIFYWSSRAKKEADIIGTIGSAYGFEKDFIDGGSSKWVPCYMDGIGKYTQFDINNIVPYASIGGLTDTRELWKEWLVKKSNYKESVEEQKLLRLKKYITNPIITSGITNGIFSACSLFLDPGESIISPNKRWGNYDNIIVKNLGAKIKSFDFFKDNKINIQGFSQAIDEILETQNKVVIILNFPNNPTGYVPTKEEAKEIVSLLIEKQKGNIPFVVIVDDAYEPFIYGEKCIEKSIFYDLHQTDKNIIPIKLDGITKELLLYGGRIGFITIGLKPEWVKNDEELEILKAEINNKLEGLNRSTISNCNNFYQTLTLKLFKEKGFKFE